MKNLSLQAEYKIAKTNLDNLVKWKNIAGLSFLHIGKILKKIKEEKLYKYLGKDSPEFETFENFIKTPEVGIELRKAYYLIQIFNIFCLKFKFKPEDLTGLYWTTLRILLPLVNKDNIEGLLEKARTLTRGHLETEIKQLKAGMDMKDVMECRHKEVDKITFYICCSCKERFKIQPKGSKIIEEK